MIILGIDPGLAIVGYGVIEYFGNQYKVLDYGAITTDSDMSFPERLETIYKKMTDIIDTYQPEDMAMEELFF